MPSAYRILVSLNQRLGGEGKLSSVGSSIGFWLSTLSSAGHFLDPGSGRSACCWRSSKARSRSNRAWKICPDASGVVKRIRLTLSSYSTPPSAQAASATTNSLQQHPRANVTRRQHWRNHVGIGKANEVEELQYLSTQGSAVKSRVMELRAMIAEVLNNNTID